MRIVLAFLLVASIGGASGGCASVTPNSNPQPDSAEVFDLSATPIDDLAGVDLEPDAAPASGPCLGKPDGAACAGTASAGVSCVMAGTMNAALVVSCAQGTCSGGLCSTQKTVSCNGYDCVGGTCSTKRVGGASCDYDEICASGCCSENLTSTIGPCGAPASNTGTCGTTSCKTPLNGSCCQFTQCNSNRCDGISCILPNGCSDEVCNRVGPAIPTPPTCP